MRRKPKAAKGEVLRARCEPQLAEWFFNVASLRHQDVSDILREAFWHYVEKHQSRYGRP